MEVVPITEEVGIILNVPVSVDINKPIDREGEQFNGISAPTQSDQAKITIATVEPNKVEIKTVAPNKLEGANVDELLYYNNVNYNFAPIDGLVLYRESRAYSLPNTYLSGRDNIIEFELSLGRCDFVDGAASYLMFELEHVGGTLNTTFGVGSAINWIDRATLISKDNQIIDDVEGVNLLSVIKDNWTKSSEYFSNQGDTKGYGVGSNINKYFICSLSDIIPLFSYLNLLSPSILDGMKIRFQMAPLHDAIEDVGVGPTIVSYSVKNIKIVLDVYTMDRTLVDEINKRMISVEFISYKHQRKHYGSNSLNMVSNFSLTKAVKAVAITKIPGASPATLLSTDQMAANTYDITKQRWRVGDRITQPISQIQESYIDAIRVFNNPRENTLNVTPSDFEADMNIVAIDLRRCPHHLQYGGTSINSKCPIELILKHTTPVVAVVRQADLFIYYLKRIMVKPVNIEDEIRGVITDEIIITE